MVKFMSSSVWIKISTNSANFLPAKLGQVLKVKNLFADSPLLRQSGRRSLAFSAKRNLAELMRREQAPILTMLLPPNQQVCRQPKWAACSGLTQPTGAQCTASTRSRMRIGREEKQMSAASRQEGRVACLRHQESTRRSKTSEGGQVRVETSARMEASSWIGALLLLLLSSSPVARCQCPWTRDLAELHSDCICDFNPSPSTNLEERHPVNRMSVQCSPVNFQQLMQALKQTASVELPDQLHRRLLGRQRPARGEEEEEEKDEREVQLAGLQLASQAKLDLLHVSNSSIGSLAQNSFIMDTSALEQATRSPGHLSQNRSQNQDQDQNQNQNSAGLFTNRHLVVAIQSLHLSRCAIERIEPGAFNGLEWSLVSLSLSDNQLEFVPKEALMQLVNLRVLDLSNNKLAQIGASSFSSLSKLNTLRLADNRLSANKQQQQANSSASHSIEPLAFVGLERSLVDLNLKNTQLSSFPSATSSLQNLAFLNLAQNQISHIPPGSFERLNSLTAINLERNRISQLEEETFKGVEGSLSSLSLLGNLLESFPVKQLAKLASIRRLDVGFNGIETLPVEAFASNRRLILIALDGNPMESLPEEAFKPLEGTLRGLSIGGKALNCDCRLSWMLRWQQEYNIQISSRERQPQFCAKPHYLRSLVSFAALKPEHLTCSEGQQGGQASFYVPYVGQNSSSSGWTANSGQASGAHLSQPAASPSPPARVSGPSWSRGEQESASTSAQPEPSSAASPRQQQLELGLGLEKPEQSAGGGVATSTALPVGAQLAQLGPSGANSATESTLDGDLAEAGTDEEPTLGSEDILLTTELSTAETQTGRAAGAFGERAHESSGFGSNSLLGAAGRPAEEELLITDPSRKLNRHGYLPALRLKQAQSAEDILRSNRSGAAAAAAASQVEPSWRSKQTQLEEHQAGRNQSRAGGQAGETSSRPGRTRIKSIHSVFGDRASGSNSTRQRENRQRANSSEIGGRTNSGQRLQPASGGPLVPAVPTVLSVYRMPQRAPVQPPQGQRLAGESPPPPPPAQKGPRFVDESQEVDGERGETSPSGGASPASLAPGASAGRPSSVAGAQLVETDIERYSSAASSLQARVSATTLSLAADSRTTELELSRAADSAGRTGEPAARSPANNTRMSVSSMYRLAASPTRAPPSPPSPSSPTSSPSTTSLAPPPTSQQSPRATADQETTAAGEPRELGRNAAAEVEAGDQKRHHHSPVRSPPATRRPADESGRAAQTRQATSASGGPWSLQTSATVAPDLLAANQEASTAAPSARLGQTVGGARETTTRMVATVRFVDSSVQQRVAQATTTTSTTTGSPRSPAPSASKQPERVAPTTSPPIATRVASSQSLAAQGGQATGFGFDGGLPTVAVDSSTLAGPSRNQSAGFGELAAGEPRGQPTPTQRPAQRQTESSSSSSRGLVVGEQQHEARLTLTSAAEKRPRLQAAGGSSRQQEQQEQQQQHQPVSAEGRPATLITKDSLQQVQRQPRDEQPPAQSADPASQMLGKFLRLADFNQLALVLAAILCLFILILAITIVCICISTRPRERSSARLASSFSSGQSIGLGEASKVKRESGSICSLVGRLLCCCRLSPKLSKHSKPMHSRILPDDDESSAGGSSNGLKSTGRSMLLSNSVASLSYGQELLFESIRKASMRASRVSQHRQANTLGPRKASGARGLGGYAFDNAVSIGSECSLRPIDHEASIQRHRQARALDQDYCAGLATRTVGRRQRSRSKSKSKSVASSAEEAITASGGRFKEETGEWVQDETLSSCDSDKSCSPGANRNNRYNMSDAHRAYLASRGAGQIQASMFVTTAAKSGLLKTIERDEQREGERQGQGQSSADYFERSSGLSSDKSTTDDSRAPLAETFRRGEQAAAKFSQTSFQPQPQPQPQLATMRTATRSFGAPVARSRSISRMPDSLAPESLAGGCEPDYLSADLLPMSAEEHWPEPYVEPAGEEGEEAARRWQGVAHSGGFNERPFVQYRPQPQPQPNQNNHTQQHRSHSTLAQAAARQAMRAEGNQQRRAHTHRRNASSSHRVAAYDDAYLANWHTMSRANQPACQQQQQRLQLVARGESRSANSLARHRSIPSLNLSGGGGGGGGASKQQGQSGCQLAGATNWLRWTPTGPAGNTAPGQEDNLSTLWLPENHVESVYVTSNQQR